MTFAENFIYNEDTIVAIATPPGEGGIAIIRLSGKDAIQIANTIFSKEITSLPSHTVHCGKFRMRTGAHIDAGLLLIMRAPSSYTGEDIVELHCHGNMVISETILGQIIKSGARLAKPGEFTFRAFRNGKIDLTQAEAVQETIGAKNQLALQAAQQHLEGVLSSKIHLLYQDLLHIAAHIEAWIDYPEEDLEIHTLQGLQKTLKKVQVSLRKLEQTFEEGRFFATGYRLCLLGSPNVGKSSLMNTLVERDRSIVTAIPGTTRDLIEEELRIGDIHCRLIDTAGVRSTEEVIEKEGIRKAREAAAQSDLLLLVLDASRELEEEEIRLLTTLPKEKTIIVWNKIDIAVPSSFAFDFQEIIALSAIESLHIDRLKAAIQRMIKKCFRTSQEEVFITQKRHHEILDKTLHALHQAQEGLHQSLSPEFISWHIREALLYLNSFFGGNVSEDILQEIFSKFCVGK